jgi:hypothetical protein
MAPLLVLAAATTYQAKHFVASASVPRVLGEAHRNRVDRGGSARTDLSVEGYDDAGAMDQHLERVVVLVQTRRFAPHYPVNLRLSAPARRSWRRA